MKTTRIAYLDVARVIACLMVIIQHSPNVEAGVSSVLQSAIGFLTYPCVPLFFMVSGALLLPVDELSISEFSKRRMRKILFPTLFWTFFYLGVKIYDGIPISLINFLSIPFSAQGSGILWFMYVLVGLYLVAPMISPWLKCAARKDIEIFLFLWGMTLMYTHIEHFLYIAPGNINALYYFAGYLGYFVLGYYLHRYFRGGGSLLISVLLLVVPIGIYGFCKLKGMEFTFDAYPSALTASMSIAWFLGIRNIMERLKIKSSILTEMSNLSFGVYLMHIFILVNIAWAICNYFSWNGALQIVVTIILTSIISFVICEVISVLPYSQYIIGYRKKKI